MLSKSALSRFVAAICFISILISQLAVNQRYETSDTENTSEETSLSQFNPQSISPSYSFSFEGIVPVTIQISHVLIDLKIKIIKTRTSFSLNSYFAKLFEHHIAINAP
jgi:hypothetical protein